MSKWSTYYFFDSKENINKLWNTYFACDSKRTFLLVMGKGFDPRMNNVLKMLLDKIPSNSIHCLTIDFPKGQGSSVDDLYKENVAQFNTLVQNYSIIKFEFLMDPKNKLQKRLKELCRDLANFDFSPYSDVIIDISSLPRSIYFNIIKVIYEVVVNKNQNIFLAVSENVEIDKLIQKNYINDEIYPLEGFEGNCHIESQLDQKRIFVPLLGENHTSNIDKIYDNFNPDDVCPILPFPSRNPRRSDDLLIEYYTFLSERIHISPQDITYADERNPFELYRILDRMLSEYKETLSPICKNVCLGIALLTSKLQSLGALLIGLEHPKEISMYDPVSFDYNVHDKFKIRKENDNSEIFLLWIKGEPYNE